MENTVVAKQVELLCRIQNLKRLDLIGQETSQSFFGNVSLSLDSVPCHRSYFAK
jgi:hypothetical protein